MKRLLAALLLLASVTVYAQEVKFDIADFGNDDVNITGTMVGNDLSGDNYSIILVAIPKRNGKILNLKAVVYGPEHIRFHAIPLGAIVVLRGTHSTFYDPERGYILVIRVLEFDYFIDKKTVLNR